MLDRILENKTLYPLVNPTVMEGVEIPLPPEIERLASIFKSDTLKDIQHEVVTPGNPNKKKVGQKIAGMSFKSRHHLKKLGVLQITGRKLYITGGVVRDWLINHFHGIAQPPDDYDLATDASPEAFKLIIKAAIAEGELPEDTSLLTTSDKFHNMHLTISGKTYEVTTFPFGGIAESPRMYLDSLRRNFSTNALYYSIDDKKIYDYHSGMTDIYRRNPKFIGKAKNKIKDNALYPLIYVRLHCRMNNKGIEALEKEIKAEVSKFILPNNVSRQAVYQEFQKGIKQALNKEKYIKILADLGLLRQVLPALNLDPNPQIGDMVMFPQIVAQILKPNWNNSGHIQEILHKLEFSQKEIHDIIFLVRLPYYTDEQTLKSERLHTGLSDRAIEQFLKTNNPRNAEWLLSVIKNRRMPIKQNVDQQNSHIRF